MDTLLNKTGLHFLIQNNKKNDKKNNTMSMKTIKSMLEQQFNKSYTPQDSTNTSTKDTLKINVGQFRSIDSFNTQTKKILDLITIGEDISPVGSSKYTVHRYPGDIDMYEEIQSCCSLQEASKAITKKIQTLAKNLLYDQDVYLADFKAGVDVRYEIRDLGEINAYNKLVGYDANTVQEQLSVLYKDELLSQTEFMEAIELVVQEPSIEEWYILDEFIRNFYIIRWDLDELIDGYIQIRSKVNKKGKEEKKLKIKLTDAIQDKSVCKLDIWAPINGRFIEVTNFLVFIYIDDTGKEHIMNISVDNYILNLIKDLKKYGKGGYKQNSLKYAKRLWSLANTLDETHKLEVLFPLFSSGAAILYQINAEIEVLINMLEVIDFTPYTKKGLDKTTKTGSKGLQNYVKAYQQQAKNITDSSPIPLMMEQIENFKSRVGLVYEHFNDSEKIFRLVNTIINFYRSKKKIYMNKKETQLIIDHLKEIDAIIQTYVEEYTSNYLKENNVDDVHQYDSIIPVL